jgi:4-diphosphocytidyl-2-C-methyl-D-erythritol kinase
MTLTRVSHCKVNLLLNILGKRPDGFHELETVLHPIQLTDELTFERTANGVNLTCDNPTLPTGARNLVHRAASLFLETALVREGVNIHLEKRIPLAAGLGGGSGNAATTLQGLNELFGLPLPTETLVNLAAALGSDVPFFMQNKPALGTGRGERVQTLASFPALHGAVFVLVYPGFGIATSWAYQQLVRFPAGLNGQRGRAEQLIAVLETANLKAAGTAFYNSLEAPALEKFPMLAIFQEFFRANGAGATLMSGSGSTTFALFEDETAAQNAVEKFKAKFGSTSWIVTVPA